MTVADDHAAQVYAAARRDDASAEDYQRAADMDIRLAREDEERLALLGLRPETRTMLLAAVRSAGEEQAAQVHQHGCPTFSPCPDCELTMGREGEMDDLADRIWEADLVAEDAHQAAQATQAPWEGQLEAD
jgi:hypothetical protein